MDGLECSEIRMSDVCDTTTLRFDSDYYKKEYLEIEQFICKNRDKFVTIESQGLQVDASAFYPSLEPYYNTGTIPFVRVADVKDQIEYNACVNIPEMGEEFRTLHMCYPGDVVLTKGGRVGTAGLITQPSYVTRDLIFINASALSRKDYIVLYLFFSSSFAYKQMVRSSSMTAQPHLTITLIRDIKAKETYYDGYRFRSRLEARWAVFFNNIGLEYEYEMEGFDMKECSYLPDFYIPSIDRWFEIKGQPLTVSEVQKCEQFCRRKDNENIKFSILIGAPKPLMLEEEDFSILGIREYTWQWPSQMYPSDTLLLAQGLTGEEYYSRFLPAIWKVDGVDDKLLIRAIREARSARFEFGETPKGR